MGKFKAVYDEAAEPVRIRRKGTDEEATVLATFDGPLGRAWILADDCDSDPYTVSMEYWEPVPVLTPSDALPGDLWQYGNYGFSPRYRVLGVDPKAGVWHFVAHESFAYKSKSDFQIQHENDGITVFTRTLPEDSGAQTSWRLVSRP